MTKKIITFLIVSSGVIASMATFLSAYILSQKDKLSENITITIDNEVNKTLTINDFELVPSKSKEYEVNLISKVGGLFSVNIEYIEVMDGGMKDFINLDIKTNNEYIYQGTLKEALDTEKSISFSCTLKIDEPYNICFEYLMPETVGNEAQGKTIDFNVNLGIKKK